MHITDVNQERLGSHCIALHCKTGIPHTAISAIQVPSISDTDIIFVKQVNESYLVGNRHNRLGLGRMSLYQLCQSPFHGKRRLWLNNTKKLALPPAAELPSFDCSYIKSAKVTRIAGSLAVNWPGCQPFPSHQSLLELPSISLSNADLRALPHLPRTDTETFPSTSISKVLEALMLPLHL